jgi:hypothetical protein
MNRITVFAIFLSAAVACGLLSLVSHRHEARADAIEARPALMASEQKSPTTKPAFSTVRGQEGFWRVARTRDGVWWFLSPQNHPEFLNGVTTVQPALRGRDPRGPDFVSRDWDKRDNQASMLRWAEQTLGRVRNAGFKSLGAWCNPVLHLCQMPMTRDLNVWHWVPYDARLFSPAWASSADAAIRGQAVPLRDNHSLIGYYIDNELNWDDEAVGPRVYFDQLPPGDPNRREVVRVIRDTWNSVADFNRDWNTTFHDWNELERHPILPMGANAGYDRLENRWLYHFAQSYFRITTSLIRKYDPNHLILGCRYRGWARPAVARGARGFTDAQSLNYYASDALLDANTFRTISEQSDQPLIISEYTFHALDGRSGDRNLTQFPGLVSNQKSRAQGYREMTARLARVPYVIGADWFQWMDEPPSGRIADGEDANMGIVDIHDRPYEQLVEAVRETAPLLDPLHAGSVADRDLTVWRQPPAAVPTTPVFAGGNEMLAK